MSEARLIDANALREEIVNIFHGITATGFIRYMRDKTPIEVYNKVLKVIDNAPTIVIDKTVTIRSIPKDYVYDTETEDFYVYRHKYNGNEIHIAKEPPLYKLESQQGEWISTSERLPEFMDNVLVTIQVGNRNPVVRSGHYAYGLFNCDNGDVWNWNDTEVKAWTPQPVPYEGTEE